MQVAVKQKTKKIKISLYATLTFTMLALPLS